MSEEHFEIFFVTMVLVTARKWIIRKLNQKKFKDPQTFELASVYQNFFLWIKKPSIRNFLEISILKFY